MSTSIIEPGTRLAGRYRLEERVSESAGSTLWKAIDEILARAVSVRTFEPDFPRAAEVVTAARTASRLTDPRLTQVFDADDTGELAYVVSEWVSGDTLEDMILSDGPLEPGRAATFVSEAAEALTAAHSSGLAHLCLTARNLVWTTGGTVKLTGLAVDAVLCSVSSGDPARIDALGLGQMLYAALTGQWPGSADESSLPLATEKDGNFRPVVEVCADTPATLNDIVSRCMEIGDMAKPLTTPAEVVAALSTVPRTPLPLFAGMQGPPPSVINRPPRQPDPQRTVPAPRPGPYPPEPQHVSALSSVGMLSPGDRKQGDREQGDRKPVNRPLVAFAGVLAAVVVGIAAWQLSSEDKPSGGPAPTASADQGGTKESPSTAGVRIQPVAARGDQQIKPAFAGHPDNHVIPTAPLLIDGKSSSYWESDGYSGANHTRFGNYLNGVGVILDLGRTADLSKIRVFAPAGSAGVPFEIRVGDSNSLTLKKAATGTTVAGNTEVDLGDAKGRYVVLWFAQGPPSGKLQIGEATVYGASG
ncbi:MAG: protein kinase family protein [Streptosporangiaceae bacterium]